MPIVPGAEVSFNAVYSYSDHIAIEKTKRRDFFAEIQDVIDTAGGQITIYDAIDLQLAVQP